MLKQFKQLIRKTHQWDKTGTCKHCGNVRIKVRREINAQWYETLYADKETGEIVQKIKCKTNQLKLL
jgi:hypothetical protein